MSDEFADMNALPYEVSFDAVDLGLCRDVDPTGVAPVTLEKKSGKHPGVILDRVHLAYAGSISLVLEEVKKTVIQKVAPWWTTGTIPMVPPTRFFSEYDNAAALILHPMGIVGTDEDITAVKAFPIFSPPRGNSEGGAFRLLPVRLNIYQVQASLPATAGLYYGAPPA